VSIEAARRRRGLLVPAVFACLGLAVLVALGIWQLDRRAWKEALIASIESRVDAAAVALPPPERWARLDPARDEFRRVTFAAEFLNGQEALVYTSGSALRSDVAGPGYWVFTPARIGGGDLVMVNRGFVPEKERDTIGRTAGQIFGVTDIEGVMRWPERSSWFTPAADSARRLWFVRDHLAMAAAKGLTVAPFYVDQEAPPAPGGPPRAGKLVVNLPNNHLQYALAWFGLALVLVGVFAAFVLSQRRERRAGEGGERA